MKFSRMFLTVATLMLGPIFAEAAEREALDLGNLPAKAVEASGWFLETIDKTTNVGPYLGVAYDEISERTFISYYDSVNGDLWLARSIRDVAVPYGNCGPDNKWVCWPLDTDGDVGKYNDIAVVGLQTFTRIVISYFDETNHALKIIVGRIEYTSDTLGIYPYTIQTGDPPSSVWYGKHTSISLDASGQPIVAYQKGNASSSVDEKQMVARAATEDTGNCGEGDVLNDWQCDIIYSAEGAGQYASIDLDGSGDPSVAFYDPGLGSPVLATEIGSGGNCGPLNSWSCTSVPNGTDDTGRFLSLAVETDGTPHLAYYNATDQTLEYASFVSSGGNCGVSDWQCDQISVIGTSIYDMGISVDLDPGGYPVIAYKDASSVLGPSVLAIARPWALLPDSTPNCGPPGLAHSTWVCEWLDSGGATRSEARAASLKVDQFGQAMVAYHELDDYPYPSEGKLKFAYEPRTIVFSDGFESGDFGSWSAVFPSPAP